MLIGFGQDEEHRTYKDYLFHPRVLQLTCVWRGTMWMRVGNMKSNAVMQGWNMITVTEDFSIVSADLPEKPASLQVYSERRLTTRNSYRRLSRTRSVETYIESYIRFPWYLSRRDVINRKYKPSAGRRYARAENEIRECREIEGSISK